MPTSRFTILVGHQPASQSEAWQQVMLALLGAQGVETLEAHTGREALGLIEESVAGSGRRIHVAVLDQRLPQMTGLQILRRVYDHLHEQHRDTPERTMHSAGVTATQGAGVPARGLPPAILLAEAGQISPRLLHEALTAHAFSVLPRPVDPNLLLDTLARALRRYYHDRWPSPHPGSPSSQ